MMKNIHVKPRPNFVIESLDDDQSRRLAAMHLARMAEIFTVTGQELQDLVVGTALDLLKTGLGMNHHNDRRIGGLPGTPADGDHPYENPLGPLGDTDLLTNRSGPLDSVVQDPGQRDELGNITSGTSPIPTVMPGTREEFSKQDDKLRVVHRAHSVVMTDGTHVISGTETRSDGSQAIFTDVSDSDGNGKTTTVIVASDGRSAVISDTHSRSEITSSQAQGNTAVIAAEEEHRRQQDDTMRSQDPQQAAAKMIPNR